MTKLLEQAMARVKALPDAEQDAIAQIVLDEIGSEKRWDELFRKAPEKHERPVDDAWKEHEAGDIEQLFSKWRGGDAIISSYSISHSILRVRVTRHDVPWSLLIICTSCKFIRGSVRWKNAALRLRTLGGLTVLEDEAAQVEISCNRAIVMEDSTHGIPPERVSREDAGVKRKP